MGERRTRRRPFGPVVGFLTGAHSYRHHTAHTSFSISFPSPRRPSTREQAAVWQPLFPDNDKRAQLLSRRLRSVQPEIKYKEPPKVHARHPIIGRPASRELSFLIHLTRPNFSYFRSHPLHSFAPPWAHASPAPKCVFNLTTPLPSSRWRKRSNSGSRKLS